MHMRSRLIYLWTQHNTTAISSAMDGNRCCKKKHKFLLHLVTIASYCAVALVLRACGKLYTRSIACDHADILAIGSKSDDKTLQFLPKRSVNDDTRTIQAPEHSAANHKTLLGSVFARFLAHFSKCQARDPNCFTA